jgi:hypothetical protein
MFPAWHIAVTALVTAAVTAVTMVGTAAWPRRPSGWPAFELGDFVGVGIAAGLGVLLWRLGANVPTLNTDPIPGVSPADVLSAPLAYVAASVYVRLRGGISTASERLAVAPAVAALAALVVNVVTI